MRNIDDIVNSGFCLDDLGAGDEYRGLAFLSLRIALKAYFSTYRCAANMIMEYNELKMCRNMVYQEACTEAIIHFQHFIELIVKDILTQKHPLLVIDAARKPMIYYKLLKGEKLEESETSQLNTVEFSESLKRINELADNNIFEAPINDLIKKYTTVMSKINTLRNRLLHRGRFVLHYEAIDNLYGRFILPLILKITSIPLYANREREWKYRRLECDIDPINEIIDECGKDSIDAKKIAFLKELARAAYENPLHDLKQDMDEADTQCYSEENDEIEKKYKIHSDAELSILNKDTNGKITINKCPVCGLRLIISNYGQGKTWLISLGGEKITIFMVDAFCKCCSFEIHSNLDNPKKYGYPIEDFWNFKD